MSGFVLLNEYGESASLPSADSICGDVELPPESPAAPPPPGPRLPPDSPAPPGARLEEYVPDFHELPAGQGSDDAISGPSLSYDGSPPASPVAQPVGLTAEGAVDGGSPAAEGTAVGDKAAGVAPAAIVATVLAAAIISAARPIPDASPSPGPATPPAVGGLAPVRTDGRCSVHGKIAVLSFRSSLSSSLTPPAPAPAAESPPVAPAEDESPCRRLVEKLEAEGMDRDELHRLVEITGPDEALLRELYEPPRDEPRPSDAAEVERVIKKLEAEGMDSATLRQLAEATGADEALLRDMYHHAQPSPRGPVDDTEALVQRLVSEGLDAERLRQLVGVTGPNEGLLRELYQHRTSGGPP
eukprot:Hpha_TRINITY_DN15370_c3_g6::TRINITY_DN15370_c3_g6_i1::g.87418::m.87418